MDEEDEEEEKKKTVWRQRERISRYQKNINAPQPLLRPSRHFRSRSSDARYWRHFRPPLHLAEEENCVSIFRNIPVLSTKSNSQKITRLRFSTRKTRGRKRRRSLLLLFSLSLSLSRRRETTRERALYPPSLRWWWWWWWWWWFM